MNRHESFVPSEVHRVLRPGGLFVTQQVGGDDLRELDEALGGGEHPYARWRLGSAADQLTAADMEVIDSGEEWLPGAFMDVGAVVLFLRVALWHMPDFSVARYDAELRRLHEKITASGSFEVCHHRFYVIAQAPSSP